jgi:hypothetical protein
MEGFDSQGIDSPLPERRPFSSMEDEDPRHLRRGGKSLDHPAEGVSVAPRQNDGHSGHDSCSPDPIPLLPFRTERRADCAKRRSEASPAVFSGP